MITTVSHSVYALNRPQAREHAFALLSAFGSIVFRCFRRSADAIATAKCTFNAVSLSESITLIVTTATAIAAQPCGRNLLFGIVLLAIVRAFDERLYSIRISLLFVSDRHLQLAQSSSYVRLCACATMIEGAGGTPVGSMPLH